MSVDLGVSLYLDLSCLSAWVVGLVCRGGNNTSEQSCSKLRQPGFGGSGTTSVLNYSNFGNQASVGAAQGFDAELHPASANRLRRERHKTLVLNCTLFRQLDFGVVFCGIGSRISVRTAVGFDGFDFG